MKIIDFLKREKLLKVKKDLPIGQFYFPDSKEYKRIFKDIFSSNSYTNHGIYLQEFESKLEAYCGVNNVICVTNATIGLIMLLEALEIKGEILIPNFTFIATLQSTKWVDLKAKFVDINLSTHHIDTKLLEKSITKKTNALLNVNLWGGFSDINQITKITKKFDLNLLHDSAQAFGSKSNNKSQYDYPHVYSFHATKILSSGEGGCIVTNDNNLAEKLRNIRSSYGVRSFMNVYRTSNGRMSEAQAAIGLFNLKNIDRYKNNNKKQFELYQKNLNQQFIDIHIPNFTSDPNYQYMTCIVKNEAPFDRDLLIKILKIQNNLKQVYLIQDLKI